MIFASFSFFGVLAFNLVDAEFLLESTRSIRRYLSMIDLGFNMDALNSAIVQPRFSYLAPHPSHASSHMSTTQRVVSNHSQSLSNQC